MSHNRGRNDVNYPFLCTSWKLRDELDTATHMTDEPTQETQPKKGDPIEVPIPSKDQIMGDFEKIAAPQSRDSYPK